MTGGAGQNAAGRAIGGDARSGVEDPDAVRRDRPLPRRGAPRSRPPRAEMLQLTALLLLALLRRRTRSGARREQADHRDDAGAAGGEARRRSRCATSCATCAPAVSTAATSSHGACRAGRQSGADRRDPDGSAAGRVRRLRPDPLERTSATGLTHRPGAVDGALGSRHGDLELVDRGAGPLGMDRRQAPADGQGFAVFGEVIAGMDVVRAIMRGRRTTSSCARR